MNTKNVVAVRKQSLSFTVHYILCVKWFSQGDDCAFLNERVNSAKGTMQGKLSLFCILENSSSVTRDWTLNSICHSFHSHVEIVNMYDEYHRI